ADLDALGDIEGPVVVAWGPSSPGRDESAWASAALNLAQRTDAKVLVCPPHAGSQGLLDMGAHPALGSTDETGRDTRAILEAAVAGEIDVLLIFGADPIRDFPDAELARRALLSVKFALVVELFPTETVQHADVVLPSAAYAEREGTFTNLERRLQKLEPLLAPPGTAREPWRVAAGIARGLDADWGWQGCDDVWDDIRSNVPTHAQVETAALTQEMPVHSLQYETGFASKSHEAQTSVAGPGGQYPKGYRSGAPFQTGNAWPLSWELRAFEARQRPGYVPEIPDQHQPEDGDPAAAQESRAAAGDLRPTAPNRSESPSDPSSSSPSGSTFDLYSGRFIYDEGSMVSKSRALHGLQKKPFVEMNDEDAKALGVADGDMVRVIAGDVEVELPVRIDDIVRGAVFVPYDQAGLCANTLMRGIDPTVEVRPA
ncbi:MAG TPA: molybdopterin-dependent oxidoreductase, partial [Actinomycetota bacterium]|nr:molybdopterin-dependent oxidoreductase [Actinomycetota bacterium]